MVQYIHISVYSRGPVGDWKDIYGTVEELPWEIDGPYVVMEERPMEKWKSSYR